MKWWRVRTAKGYPEAWREVPGSTREDGSNSPSLRGPAALLPVSWTGVP